jgi:hypothetical protein
MSSSKHVLRRRLVEVIPQAQVSYSYSGNSEIQFDLNSPSDFFDMQNSYIRMDLTCDITNGGSDAARKYLAEGGAHSLFRTLIIETQSGVLLQRIDRYNKLYSIMSSASHSPEYVDHVLSRAGDSVSPAAEDVLSEPSMIEIDATAVTFTAATNTFAVLTADVARDIEAGDLLHVVFNTISAGTLGTYSLRVQSVTDTTVVVDDPDNQLLTGNAAAGEIDHITVVKNQATRETDAVRRYVANQDAIAVSFQPFAPLMNMSNWLPLFLIRGGIRVRLVMDRPEYCLAVPEEPTGAGFAGANVQIDNPRYVCTFVQPDQTLSNQYVDIYRSKGITYNYSGVRHFLDIQSGGGAATHNMQMNSNVRSARAVLGRVQNLRAETVTAATVDSGKSTYTCDSIAQGLKSHMSQYQFASGSERFPLSRPVDMTDFSNAEAFTELERVFKTLGAVNVSGKRFKPVQWAERSHFVNRFEATGATDSQRLIISADLSRDATPWAGLDLSLQPLQAELTFDAQSVITDLDGSSNSANADRYFNMWLLYDQAVSISENGVLVFN